MARADEEYIIELRAKMDRFETDLRKVNIRLDDLSKDVQKHAKKMESAFSGLGKAIIAVFSYQKIKEFTKDTASAAFQLRGIEVGLRTVTGSSAAAAKELEFLRKETNRLGINMLDNANAYTKLLAATRNSNLEGQATRDIFIAVVEAATVLNLSTEQVTGALRALEQMASKGVVTMEELKLQLGDRITGVMRIAAQAMGVTTAEFLDMVESGELLTDEFLPKFAQAMRNEFAGGVEEAGQRAQAELVLLGSAFDMLQAKIGKAVTETETFKRSVSGLADLLEGEFTSGFSKIAGALDFFGEGTIKTAEEIQDAIDRLVVKISDGTITASEKMQLQMLQQLKLNESIKEFAPAAKEATQEGNKLAESTKEQVDKAKELIDALQFEKRMYDLTEREQQVQIALRRAGKDATAAQKKEIENLAGSIYDLNKAQEEATRKQEQEIETLTMLAEEARNYRSEIDLLGDSLMRIGENALDGFSFTGRNRLSSTISAKLGGSSESQILGDIGSQLATMGGTFLGGPIGGVIANYALDAILSNIGGTPHPASTFNALVGDAGAFTGVDFQSKHVDTNYARQLSSSVQRRLADMAAVGIDVGGLGTHIFGGTDVGRGGSFLQIGNQDQISFDPEVYGDFERALDEFSNAIIETLGGTGTFQDAVDKFAETQEDQQETLRQMQEESAAAASRLQEASQSLNSAMQEASKLADSFRSAAASLQASMNNLLLGSLSPLSPSEQLATARRLFEETNQKAAAGDLTALNNLGGVTQAFLTASQNYNASGVAYAADFAIAQEALSGASGVATGRASFQQGRADRAASALGVADSDMPYSSTSGINALIAEMQAMRKQQEVTNAKLVAFEADTAARRV